MKTRKVVKWTPKKDSTGKENVCQNSLAEGKPRKRSREAQVKELVKRIHKDDPPLMISTWLTNFRFVTGDEYGLLLEEVKKLRR